jgi:hypothetical protein
VRVRVRVRVSIYVYMFYSIAESVCLLCTGAADSLSEVNGAVVILLLHSHSSLIRTKPALT